ncbi:MAG TPA: bifunctional ADP-dependent NAD(P)H-hydrate dehydratase/NAD(P)H-hydrate epimerase, partial [Deltaproteobacteria bacterium]|nr:bifunctional ADP-dependent NAD(P)H-hydrate dehydratase/NAD(P)H-hydrate epimerase [Deltaproteobacteria bacterium]
MRELDHHAIENLGIPGMVLMENAARSFSDLLEKEILSKRPQDLVVICCGKGNNGGD